jgi:hypothetical protein
MAKDSRYDAELEYLSDYTADVLRELSWMITMDGVCDAFEPRMTIGNVDCRHCSYTKSNHRA